MVKRLDIIAAMLDGTVEKLATDPAIEATALAHTSIEKLVKSLPADHPAQKMLAPMLKGLHTLGTDLVGRAIRGPNGGSEDE